MADKPAGQSGPEHFTDPDDFEKVVAALLKVDPEGITGQRAKKKDDEAEAAD